MGAVAPDRVDVVVVGSGFGGSVVAARLAEAGRSVCVLERGRRYPPGSFPRRPAELARNFWAPAEGMHGLFDVWSFRHVQAVVAAGLGGGSLIYANVMLRKDERWFVADAGPAGGYEAWPVTRDDLEPHYDRVEKVFGATCNPYPYADTTPKTVAMRRAAGRLGVEWFRPPLAVAFAGPGQRPGVPIPDSAGNLHRTPRATCSLCGECDLGCNTGAKNSLDYTCLSAAEAAGADLRDRCEVRSVRRVDGGYEVGYVEHPAANDGVRVRDLPVRRVRGRLLVLAAGALGSTGLLLRNRAALPGLSAAVGSRFSGNGDLLGFVLGSPDRLEPSYGPVITSTMRVPDALDGADGRGFYLQEGGYPGFVDWLLESGALTRPLGRLARFGAARALDRLLGRDRTQIGAQVAALVGTGRVSAGALPMLGMGRDVPDGRLRLRRGQLDLEWRDSTSREYFSRVEAAMAAVAGELGGRFVVNPSRYLHRVVTAHPLGGAPMAADPRRGVVDPYGEAYGLPGLFVADGAVLPGPVGANPSLTIAALADRFADRMLDRLPGGPR
jgi:cholesterol oxidase